MKRPLAMGFRWRRAIATGRRGSAPRHRAAWSIIDHSVPRIRSPRRPRRHQPCAEHVLRACICGRAMPPNVWWGSMRRFQSPEKGSGSDFLLVRPEPPKFLQNQNMIRCLLCVEADWGCRAVLWTMYFLVSTRVAKKILSLDSVV